MPRQERRSQPACAVEPPFSYQSRQRRWCLRRAPKDILDIGYRGVLAELERELGLFEELKLEAGRRSSATAPATSTGGS